MTHDLEDLAPGAYNEVEEVIRELFSRIPYGQPIMLSNGREFTIEKVSKAPKLKENGWTFMIDARFKRGPGLDHLEFTVEHTGGGGFVTHDGSLQCDPEIEK